MRATYVDESARDRDVYFFGGLIVDDVAALAIESGLDGIGRLIADTVGEFDPQTEFHGHEMFHGEKGWDGVPVALRVKASELVAKVVARSGAEYVFRGIDLIRHRARYGNPYPAHLLTFAHLLGELDDRMSSAHGDEVALVLADDHHSAENSRRNRQDFKIRSVPGYTTRQLARLLDTIYFGSSHASRLLQAADVATYFLNRRRTIVEGDPRAEAAMARIVANIRRATVSEYVWVP